VVLDYLSLRTPRDLRRLRELSAEVGDRLVLVSTAASDPEADRTAWPWRALCRRLDARRSVAHPRTDDPGTRTESHQPSGRTPEARAPRYHHRVPPAAEDAQVPRGDVEVRVRTELGRRLVGWTELGTGTNNRLFRLDLADGPTLLAKVYARDRWDRLGTEFGALALLAARGAVGVPRPYLRSDALRYGVYSFEPGARKAPADLDADDGRAAAGLAAALHAFGPDDAGEAGGALGTANPACFSLADQLAVIERRLRSFEAFAAGPGCYHEVRTFAREADLRAAVARETSRATAGLTPDELASPLPRAAWRLNTNDFGPHNLLFGDGRLTVVDFEGAGWDDPARMVMGFVAHAGSEGLPPPAGEAFLGAYAAARGLSAAEVARFERVGRLADVEWATVSAYAVTPEAVAPKRFGTADFDLPAHPASCLGKLRERLARAERGDGYRFPPGRR
jgi:Ser/Thr protein kinase RdoA (MazF antagonist)